METIFQGSSSPLPARAPLRSSDISCNTAIALSASADALIVVALVDEPAVRALGFPLAFDARNFVSGIESIMYA